MISQPDRTSQHRNHQQPAEAGNGATIDRDHLKAILETGEPVRLIMVQGPGRFHAAHIPGSETFASFEEALQELDIDDPIIVYCSGGHASAQAQRWLKGQGYRNVRRYPGGLADWHAAGLPLEGDNRLRACS